MTKTFTEDLILWDSGANKGKVNWAANIGNSVRFIYKGRSGTIVILSKHKNIIEIEYMGMVYKVKANSIMHCHLGGVIDCNIAYIDVIWGLEEFIKKNGSFPSVTQIGECEYLPGYNTVNKLCRENNTTIDRLAYSYGFSRNKPKRYEYDNYVEKYKKIANENGMYIKSTELNKYDLPSSRWFVMYCPNKSIRNYNEFVEWLGFKSAYTSKEKAIELIFSMQQTIGRPLMYDDFRDPSADKTSIGIVNRYWGSMNKMKEELGLEIVQEDMIGRSKPKEDLLDDLRVYIEKNNQIPSSGDFGEDELLSSATYFKYFGGINNAIEELGYEPNKRCISKNMTNEEIIDHYRKFFDDNGIAMTYEYCSNTKYLPSPATVLRRFDCKWNDFITMLGYDIVQTPLGQICEAMDGTICLSKSECAIHNILLKLDVEIEKEVLYREFCSDYDGLKRCDWILNTGDKKFIVEYFGIMNDEKYKFRHDEKLELIKSNNLIDNFIALYPKDLKDIENVLAQKLNNTK